MLSDSSVVAERRPSNGHAMRLADAAVTEAAPPLSALQMMNDSANFVVYQKCHRDLRLLLRRTTGTMKKHLTIVIKLGSSFSSRAHIAMLTVASRHLVNR